MTLVRDRADVIDLVREGLADALRTIPGCQASANVLNNPHPPHAHVMRGDTLYDQAMSGGIHRLSMRVRVFVAQVSDIGGQKLLDQFLSPQGERSVKAAIEADTTLGGVVQDLHVTQATGEQEYLRDQGGPLLGSEWSVDIWL